MAQAQQYIVGIDEVGRGPLAGPVAVGVFKIAHKELPKLLKRGIAATGCLAQDSKAMAAPKRELWTAFLKQERVRGTCDFAVYRATAKRIDTLGIAVMIRACLAQGLKKVCRGNPATYTVLLDGGLYAPAHFVHQQTIIKGDAKEAVIALASIVAKTNRDAYMKKVAKQLPVYGFERHVGYGTKVHREAIVRHGPSVEHRMSFLKKCLSVIK